MSPFYTLPCFVVFYFNSAVQKYNRTTCTPRVTRELQRQRCTKIFTTPRVHLKTFFSVLKKRSRLLQRWRCSCKFESRRIESYPQRTYITYTFVNASLNSRAIAGFHFFSFFETSFAASELCMYMMQTIF
jgi:hypothetical protein